MLKASKFLTKLLFSVKLFKDFDLIFQRTERPFFSVNYNRHLFLRDSEQVTFEKHVNMVKNVPN